MEQRRSDTSLCWVQCHVLLLFQAQLLSHPSKKCCWPLHLLFFHPKPHMLMVKENKHCTYNTAKTQAFSSSAKNFLPKTLPSFSLRTNWYNMFRAGSNVQNINEYSKNYYINQLPIIPETFHGIFLLAQLFAAILFYFLWSIPGIFCRWDRTLRVQSNLQSILRIFHKQMEQKHNKQPHKAEHPFEYSDHEQRLLPIGRISNGIFFRMQLFVMFLFHFFVEYSRNILQVRLHPYTFF